MFWIVLFSLQVVLCYRGIFLERRANNPLHGFLDPILSRSAEIDLTQRRGDRPEPMARDVDRSYAELSTS